MQAPSQDLRPIPPAAARSSRAVSLVLVALLHVAIIYALATGLAHQMIELLPQNINATIIPQQQQKLEPPPPPPPQFKQPPPFVPPPDVTVDLTQAPATNAIAAQSAQKGITAPASVGRAHTCDKDKYYTSEMRNNNLTGTVGVALHIGADGTISNVRVTKSSGHPELDAATVQCVSSAWHYKPAMQNGQPVEAEWAASVQWRLTN